MADHPHVRRWGQCVSGLSLLDSPLGKEATVPPATLTSRRFNKYKVHLLMILHVMEDYEVHSLFFVLVEPPFWTHLVNKTRCCFFLESIRAVEGEEFEKEVFLSMGMLFAKGQSIFSFVDMLFPASRKESLFIRGALLRR
ncbi:hypothetical protein CEXT_41631 [Caerostris extrusa]|uniref:Uncharacterized protein n=1 Tax=Caerostris extrusa TaxID=172846 RepID=A0AAV4PY01_CAEEX|nr:hypothetical protein CEXT_41631 [Caerostris extrusa]